MMKDHCYSNLTNVASIQISTESILATQCHPAPSASMRVLPLCLRVMTFSERQKERYSGCTQRKLSPSLTADIQAEETFSTHPMLMSWSSWKSELEPRKLPKYNSIID